MTTIELVASSKFSYFLILYFPQGHLGSSGSRAVLAGIIFPSSESDKRFVVTIRPRWRQIVGSWDSNDIPCIEKLLESLPRLAGSKPRGETLHELGTIYQKENTIVRILGPTALHATTIEEACALLAQMVA